MQFCNYRDKIYVLVKMHV